MNNMIRPRQLIQLIKARALEMIREPGVLFWGIVFPILIAQEGLRGRCWRVP